jgi:hypothetical protein
MATTFTKIAAVTVGSGGASSIDFTSIPSTYTDLCVKLSGRLTSAAVTQTLTIQFNGSTSSYSTVQVRGNGTAASSVSNASGTDEINLGELTAATGTSNTFGSVDLYVPNYAGSSNKSISADAVSENNATLAWSMLTAGLWSNTSAITSIKFLPTGGDFAQYSTATLYGIKNS